MKRLEENGLVVNEMIERAKKIQMGLMRKR